MTMHNPRTEDHTTKAGARIIQGILIETRVNP